MIRHEQYLQDVQILTSMYSSCADVLYGGKPKHPHWTAIFLEGPMDQIRQAQAEMHEYLALPNPLPDVALPADSDEVLPITNADEFRLALEQLRRVYLVAGSVRGELAPFRPHLAASLLGQMIAQLSTIHKVLRTWLRWTELEALLGAMEKQFGADGEPSTAGVPLASVSLPEDKPVS